MEKGTSTIILLVVGVMVLLGLSTLLIKGTGSADPLSVLPCIIAGGKDCEAKSKADSDIKKDLTASISAAIKCAYLVCFDENVVKGCNNPVVKTLSWDGKTSCFDHFCKDTTKPTICGEDSEKNAIYIKPLEKVDFIPIHPLEKPLDKVFVNRMKEKCGVDWGPFVKLGDEILVDVRIDERLLDNENVKKDCDRASLGPGFGNDRGPGDYGSPQKECRLKSDAEIYVYHQEYIYDRTSGKFANIVTLCSEKPIFATKPNEGTPKGSVTLFADEQAKDSGGAFLDIYGDTPNVENVKGWGDGPTSVTLKDGYVVVLYNNKNYEGDCRTLRESHGDLRKKDDIDFSDATRSVRVWKDSKGAILYDSTDFKKNNNNEFYPDDGVKHNLETRQCIHKKTESVEILSDLIVVLYDIDTILKVTDTTGNLPSEIRNKATHVKVCKKGSTTCLTPEENSRLNK